MADPPSITVEELAKEAGLSLQCLDKAFREEKACILAEFCDQWELIGYHLRLVRADITTIKNDNETTDLRRISMLARWSEKFAYKATYRVLLEALIRSKHGKQARDLCRALKHELATGHTESEESHAQTEPVVATKQITTVCRNTSSEELVPDVDITQSIDQLEKRFIYIQNQFLQSGIGTRVTLEKLKTCISTLPSFTTDTPQLLLKAESIDLFIFNLKRYCYALNPDILEGLIAVLGDTETKSMMEKYNKALYEFQSKTKLKDFIGNYEGPTLPEFKNLHLKLGDNWREKTLADLKLLNLQISRRSWLVNMVSEHSVLAIFMVPKEDDLEIGVHLRDYLQSQCVLWILVDGVCIFNCEGIFTINRVDFIVVNMGMQSTHGQGQETIYMPMPMPWP